MMNMRMTRFLNIAVLCTLVATSAAVFAQDEKPQEAKPPRQEEAKPEPKQDEMKAPKQEKQDQMKPAQQGDMKPEKQEEAKPAQRQEQEARPSKDEQKAQKEQQKQQEKQRKEQMKQDKNHAAPAAAQNNENNAAARGGAVGHPKGKSAHIPEDRFKSNFGQSHKFVVQRTTVVQGQPGFVYGGYSFVFIDPWPADWAYTDDCYVDYIDGEYFLFDLLHPGIRIALFVAL
jgi:cell division protein FtsN